MAAVPDDYSARVRTLELASQSNADRLEAHEDICAERYKNIHDGMAAMRSDNKQTNTYLIGIGLMVIAGLAKLVFFP
jgi:hypothetical protein